EGYAPEAIQLTRAIDLRYVGQSFELRLPIRSDTELGEPRQLDRRFGDEHERTYGHRADGDPVEIVNLRVTAEIARSLTPGPSPAKLERGEAPASYTPSP